MTRNAGSEARAPVDPIRLGLISGTRFFFSHFAQATIIDRGGRLQHAGLPRPRLLGMCERSGGLTLHLQRLVPAPPPVVFRMHAEADLFTQWFGPKEFVVRSAEFDVRVGGGYRFWMQPPEGEPFAISGDFREVDPPVRLVYTFLYDDPDPDDQETVVTFALRAVNTSTEVTVEQGPFTTEPRRSLHQQGWSDTLDRLEAVLLA